MAQETILDGININTSVLDRTYINLNGSSTTSNHINLQNNSGFWHLSGPRSFEANNTFSIYWNNGSYNRYFNLLDNGRIGIGTSTPARRIEIGDESTDFSAFGRFDGSWSTQYEKHSRIEFNDQNFGIGAGAITNNSSTDDDLYLWSYNGEGRDISFLSTANGNSDPSTWNHNMIIKGTNGFVGIGTIDPKSRLSVNGQIRATEVKVLAVISVPDYVFEPGYELRTLKETKEYITKNKHLPEIPSATEIGENGIDLGDMNMRLLKKIEELTLYQIELMEKLEKQQKRIEKLESK